MGLTLSKPLNSDAPPTNAWVPAQRARRMLWEIGGSMQCTIIGTCLSEDDLLAAIRRCGLSLAPDASSYDIHAYCVKTATSDNALARTLHKLLDRRYGGSIRLVARTEGAEQLQALWAKLRDSGQIGAGYWAILSHTHIPAAVATQVFGEVHMLSHLHGRGARDMATRVAELERRRSETEARLRRAEVARNEALAERDVARVELAARADGPADRGAAPPIANQGTGRRMGGSGKRERILAAARARARHAESENARLLSALQAMQRTQRLEKPVVASCPCCTHAAPPCRLDGRRILYLGGRKNILPHLRSAAEAREAILLVHDGGVEDSARRIEELVGGCDAVVCPIDCVSHGACKLAKVLCRRFNKPFLPIPTASRSGFERALDQLAASGPRPADAQADVPGGRSVAK